MPKLWHISDIHLSFKADGTVQKPMDLRKWSQGSTNYVGYLDKIANFGSTRINSSDFVVVTGDLTHDMKHVDAINSLRWFRQNVNGVVVMCRGNHDAYLNVGNAKIADLGNNMFLMGEGEISTIGPYTFGCYSDHSVKDSGTNSKEYLDIAQRVVAQALVNNTIPVVIGHYPVNLSTAQDMGKLGLKGYLSGHIHCTQGDQPGGNDWTWYDVVAKPTDNKTVEGCFFSTGTTDVLIQTQNGQIFKEVKALESSTVSKQTTRSKAAAAFKCHDKFISKFENVDPFNPGNTIAGFMCRHKGLMGGSLFITHVNNVEVNPELIFGTPKLAYAYNDNDRSYKTLPKARYYQLDEKWNGTNILFYKYHDSHGNVFVTAKTKGVPVVKDSDFGDFFSLTKEALDWDGTKDLMADLPPKLMGLMYDSYQSISFELCGRKEPHLVKYDFDIDLKPLFYTREDGRIEPCSSANRKDYINSSSVTSACSGSQDVDTSLNESYRATNGLEHKYEYEHMAVEGKVLYLLDDNGICIDRTLYKIKARDVEEVHWQTFDTTMQGRVKEALSKLGRDEVQVSEQALKEELDMGPKEWAKFGDSVMAFANRNPGEDKRQVVVLVGLPGSGKSTLAKQLESRGFVRVNQDELGSRNKCKDLMETALLENKSVVVDRCNFDVRQRKSWLDLASKHGVKNVKAVTVVTDPDLCKDRIVKRSDHPTIAPVEESKKVVDFFSGQMVEVEISEGFTELLEFSGKGSADELIQKLTQ